MGKRDGRRDGTSPLGRRGILGVRSPELAELVADERIEPLPEARIERKDANECLHVGEVAESNGTGRCGRERCQASTGW